MLNLQKIASLATGTAMLALGMLSATPARSATMVLDFETGNGLLPPGQGQIINGAGLFTDFGVTIGTTNPNNNPLLLFNSNCGPDFPGVPCTGNDGDLASGPSFGTAPQGNVLIIQNDGSAITNPNDDPDGGTIEFSFDSPVTFKSANILDLDEGVGPISFKFFFEGDPVGQIINPTDIELLGDTTGDNSLREFKFNNLKNVKRVDVTLNDVSGAIGSLTYALQEVPEPASVMGLLAVGILGVLKRKQSNS
ncbi:MAG: PEP-CTERM sorting domain-containing protein [Cyanobacteriota bacterium]|nr:PEP-CTERM sorting domain-containing protein [Cyanobacteriota bacterium]